MKKELNIVLVHGAWGDGSHWKHVIPVLHAKGYTVRAVQNPLTSLPEDIERTKNLVDSLEGPTLLVGHSYGGMVITNVGNEDNVVGLVYIAAFAPDEGETAGGIFSLREAPPGAASLKLDAQSYFWIDFDQYHENFCQDVPDEEALVMGISQKPLAARCFGDVSGIPAWKVKPSWYQVSEQDRMIPPETEAFMAERMKTQKTITLNSSHASLASHGQQVADFILEAAESIQKTALAYVSTL
ncbi:alpha/beta hydrolase [Spirosoma endbachense]|uniref:Alpha/beta fold hydrolase n=1 Tax=Spirosoma endbachense TaxID=2666025 RepID=A0A6P1W620_9BACT|nr:alpha/beta hydrolase [Spirosoma endbachense]QHV99380.1 alpha/beta fold hydrolase [Spirosoma endbachense]